MAMSWSNAIAPTLGPTPRHSIARNQAKFELLDDGGLIARRIIALPEKEDDVGAMLLRQVLWQVHQHVGDGAATTAVLYERIYQEGLRFIAAGANPMRLRAGSWNCFNGQQRCWPMRAPSTRTEAQGRCVLRLV